MKKALFLFCLSFSFKLFALDCADLLEDHIRLVDQSEALIQKIVTQDKLEVTQYEISSLQKLLTLRFQHLKNTMNAYNDSKGCPAFIGEAVAIYDFTQLGSKALNDTKTRRIINNLAKCPKYQLTSLKDMYKHYTSHKFIESFLDRLEADKLSLPDTLSISTEIKKGRFNNPKDWALNNISFVVSGTARVWGFLSDRLKWRNGRLNNSKEVIDQMRKHLKPLDLIFETRSYVLSNFTIPGHWGHVAVWLGTREDFEGTEIWNKDFFKPIKEAILSGNNIIETRKQGIQFVSLESFTNLDEIAITRIKKFDDKEAIYQGLVEQLDSKYDFTFNAFTPDKITCAEMIAYSFGDIKWPETKTLLNITLRPDDMAILSLRKNSPMDLILYLKGLKGGQFEVKSFEEWSALF